MTFRTFIAICSLAIASVLIGTACNKQDNNEAAPVAAPDSAPTTAAQTPSPSTPASIAVQPGGRGLSGLYVISEVDDGGKVSMVNPDNEISLFFQANGFTRITKENGKVVHTDGGQYRIDPPDQLTLSSSVSDKQPLITPSEKTHQFDLSPDGEELKLWGASGKVAVFRRRNEKQ